MPDQTIFQFPNSAKNVPVVSSSSTYNSHLFGRIEQGKGKIAFFDIEAFNEDSFLGILAKNSVTGIIDLRPRPVFNRPHFRHQNVVSYFHKRNVAYLEFALLQLEARKAGQLSYPRSNFLDDALEKLLDRGLTIGIFDVESKSLGWLDFVRSRIREVVKFAAELNPRALMP